MNGGSSSGKRRGLGRGLGALIPPSETGDAARDETRDAIPQIPVSQIGPNPMQPRHHVDEELLEELAASIREHGLIQPLVLTRADDGSYRLIAGERRWRAAQMVGLETVPAIIRETSSREMLELALVENLQRADLNPLEEAAAYQQMLDEFGMTQEEVAKRVGRSRAAVANILRLLRLSDEAKAALAGGLITEGHARALLRIPDADSQGIALDIIISRGLNVRQAEELARKMALVEEEAKEEDSTPKPPDELSPHDKDMIQRFETRLGTRVRLARGKRGGRITIDFYSEEELEAIYRAILGDEVY